MIKDVISPYRTEGGKESGSIDLGARPFKLLGSPEGLNCIQPAVPPNHMLISSLYLCSVYEVTLAGRNFRFAKPRGLPAITYYVR